jgi:adenylate cyclase
LNHIVKKKGNFLVRVFPKLAPPLVLVLLIGAQRMFPEAVEGLELKAFDIFQRLKPRAYEEAPVRIVDIDDESLARLGQWPWPRTQVAQLVTHLAQSGARAIVFDIVFAEADRTSPKHTLTLLPETSEFDLVRSQMSALPDHDQILAKAVSRANVVTGFSFSTSPTEAGPKKKASFSYAGDNPLQYLPEFAGAVVNLPELESESSGNGSFAIIAESDGIIRRVPLLFRFKNELYPSLALEAVRTAQGAQTYIVKSSGSSGERSFGEHTGISSVRAGRSIVPTDSEGRLWLYDTSYRPEPWIPAWQVLSDGFNRESVADTIVFIGTSASGLKDIRATPLNPVAAGVEVHAQLVEQILVEDFLRRPDWAPGAEFLYLILLGLILILLMPRLGALWCALIGGISIAAVLGISWYAFSRHQWLLDPILPSAACFVIYLTASLANFMRTESERLQIRSAFSHYLSPALVERLAKDPAQLKLGGETRNITILFADIRGFTSISEKMDAQELTRFMNQYLTPMTELILKQSGTIDKYIGDCIMAFWNAPLSDPHHSAKACSAALSMRDFLVRWNGTRKEGSELKGEPFIPIHIGVGINTGDCCVGNIGSEQCFNYSALGDDVNLASRLEGETKVYGVDVIIGEKTRDQVQDYAALELDLIRVKGKEKPTRIFALLGDQTLKNGADFRSLSERHEKMLAAYRSNDWANALREIEACLETETAKTRLSKLYKLYEEKVRQKCSSS